MRQEVSDYLMDRPHIKQHPLLQLESCASKRQHQSPVVQFRTLTSNTGHQENYMRECSDLLGAFPPVGTHSSVGTYYRDSPVP